MPAAPNGRAMEYLRKRREGRLRLDAPAASGSYDLRMYDDREGRELASVTVVVVTDLNGRWIDDDGNTFTIRQELDKVWVTAHGRLNRRFAGRIEGDTFRVTYRYTDADVTSGV